MGRFLPSGWEDGRQMGKPMKFLLRMLLRSRRETEKHSFTYDYWYTFIRHGGAVIHPPVSDFPSSRATFLII